jgi:hypothetical protein
MNQLEVKTSPSANLNKSIDLGDRIRIEEVKDDRGIVIFRFVQFNLDPTSIKRILQAKRQGERLQISPSLLDRLRFLALSDGEHMDGGNRWQSGLTFCTYFESAGRKSDRIAMRSVIGLDGDIINQIRADLLGNSQTSTEIASSHYWLIERLLDRLPMKKVDYTWLKTELTWWVWGISLGILAMALFLYLAKLLPMVVLILALLIAVGILLTFYIWQPSLRPWIWQRWLRRFLSTNESDRQQAMEIWQKLVQ